MTCTQQLERVDEGTDSLWTHWMDGETNVLSRHYRLDSMGTRTPANLLQECKRIVKRGRENCMGSTKGLAKTEKNEIKKDVWKMQQCSEPLLLNTLHAWLTRNIQEKYRFYAGQHKAVSSS